MSSAPVSIRASKAIVSRFVYARLLIQKGSAIVERKQVASAGFGVLCLQDGVEMALRAIAELVECSELGEQASFDKIISGINDKVPSRKIPRRQALTRLNKARVGFKHFGNLPTDDDAIEIAQDARRFFSEAVSQYLGTSESDFSFADLIDPPRARMSLKAAERSLGDCDFAETVWWSARAFVVVFKTVGVKLHDSRFSKYSSGYKLDYFGDNLRDLKGQIEKGFDFVAESTKDLQSSIDALAAHIEMLEHGLSLSELRRFTIIAPSAELNSAGTINMYVSPREAELSESDARFAIDFVTRSLLNAPEPRIIKSERGLQAGRKMILKQRTEVFLAAGFEGKGKLLCVLDGGTTVNAKGDQWDRSGLLHFDLDEEGCVVGLNDALAG